MAPIVRKHEAGRRLARGRDQQHGYAMTCEVVVMNRMGVALAADSAVTADVGENSKIHESGVKLFTLSKHRPVGVMVYNNSLLLGVPWETIIKMFRHELGHQRYDTVSEYAEALIDYVEQNTPRFFPEEIQDLYFVQALEAEIERIKEDAIEGVGLRGERS